VIKKTVFMLMAVFAMIVVSTGAIATPAAEQAFRATGECQFNCATTVKVGNARFVVARDSQGEIFKVISANVPGKAKLAENQSSEQINVLSTGDSTSTSADTYIAPTETVVLTTIMHSNADGDLVDVQVNTNRFPHTVVQ